MLNTVDIISRIESEMFSKDDLQYMRGNEFEFYKGFNHGLKAAIRIILKDEMNNEMERAGAANENRN